MTTQKTPDPAAHDAETEALAEIHRKDRTLDENRQEHLDEKLEEALEESFPASDPVAVTVTTGTEEEG
ncbi:hypothetical protein [Prosthecomicrobium pneumaticum]|uniref:Uncharacterized protein n=1 Tax=Prosthecomicrobium pneumaticum TaxID=81895 RepID=A0A7W9FJJ9_9HYPH|nr:hypothetical protein [Prosthecomicrobium pneumaticum]MBB5751782.1 hypothetical protein [Prosthecomicrobium pneumaticum]